MQYMVTCPEIEQLFLETAVRLCYTKQKQDLYFAKDMHMKKTLKKPKTAFLKDNRFIFLSGICAFVMMMLVYYCYDLIPFGDMTSLRVDLYHRYGPWFAGLYDRITSGGSLFGAIGFLIIAMLPIAIITSRIMWKKGKITVIDNPSMNKK